MADSFDAGHVWGCAVFPYVRYFKFSVYAFERNTFVAETGGSLDGYNRFGSHLFLMETSEVYRSVSGHEFISDDIELELLGPNPH